VIGIFTAHRSKLPRRLFQLRACSPEVRMINQRTTLALLVSALPLGGCVPMMAAQAVSMVANSARGTPVSNAALQPQAREQCSAHAQQYGAVHVIDVEQRSTNKIIVWGTVGEGAARRSFQCDYGTRITGFKLRTISAQPAS